jgi:hypothetical protein
MTVFHASRFSTDIGAEGDCRAGWGRITSPLNCGWVLELSREGKNSLQMSILTGSATRALATRVLLLYVSMTGKKTGRSVANLDHWFWACPTVCRPWVESTQWAMQDNSRHFFGPLIIIFWMYRLLKSYSFTVQELQIYSLTTRITNCWKETEFLLLCNL